MLHCSGDKGNAGFRQIERDIMDSKATGIVAYITWIGLIIAFVAGDKVGAKFHLNQALVIWLGYIIAGVLRFIPIVGTICSWVLDIFLLVCLIIALVGAIQGEEKEAPLIGQIKLYN